MSPADLNERADLACDCFGDRPELWGAACKQFDDDDQGCCYNCGHAEACHGNK